MGADAAAVPHAATTHGIDVLGRRLSRTLCPLRGFAALPFALERDQLPDREAEDDPRSEKQFQQEQYISGHGRLPGACLALEALTAFELFETGEQLDQPGDVLAEAPS